jgi:hypothetical protein
MSRLATAEFASQLYRDWRRGPSMRGRTDEQRCRPLVRTRSRARRCRACATFIGESPHKDEITPEKKIERSPFRGSAGRDWWAPILACAGRHGPHMLSRAEHEQVCHQLRIAVLNAVQYPIDPKISQHYPNCVPREFLEFDKGTRDRTGNGKGPCGYKTVFQDQDFAGTVGERIIDLTGRLERFSQMPAQIVCLGNDSRWFVSQAIQRLHPACALTSRPLETIPHPARWKFSSPGNNIRAVAIGRIRQLVCQRHQ